MADIRPGSLDSAPESLTTREQEILVCLGDGLSNQEIAHRLYLAEKTVRWYNTQIYSKLGVSNRQEAIERARALGLLEAVSEVPPIVGKHNLPAQATPFVGRRDELGELARLLNDPDTRLITILAPGGMGKTRLALQAAHLEVGHYADGVFFVPLAPLSAASDIVTTIAETIGFSFYGANTPMQQLIDFLSERSMLLVLDNFEHLLDGAPLVADLIQTASDIRVLTTSRERLNLRGETVYTLRGLDFATWESPEGALKYEAVKLFLQSAQRVRPDFEIQSDTLDELARICRLTAGMPLGIELAAGWVDLLALEQIAAELQKGLDILETEMRDVPERQRSLRATFDPTWKRLSDEEQHVFMRLSVFRGGFTLEAARAVTDADVRLLRKLASKALVQTAPEGRHDIHELLRQYGVDKLAAAGEQAQIEAKHAAYFADFMAERKQDVRTNRQFEALALIDTDFENVRVAWLHTIDAQAWDTLPKFLHSLWFYCEVRTRGREAVALLEQAVKALQSALWSDVTDLALGRVLARLGWFYNDTGFYEQGASTCDEAVRLLHQHDSPDDLIAALHQRLYMAHFRREADGGLSIAQQGLDIARAVGDASWEAYLLIGSGFSSRHQGEFAAAFQVAEQALTIFEGLGDSWGILRAYFIVGWSQGNLKGYEWASRWFQQVETLAEAFGHAINLGECQAIQAGIALQGRNYAAARLHFRKALQIFWNAGYLSILPYPLAFVARMFADQNELERGVEILAALHKHPMAFAQTDQRTQALRDELQAKLEAERFNAVWARGEVRELNAVVAELLAEFAEA